MLRVLICLLISIKAFSYSSCEINFVSYVNGELPADLAKNPALNLWDERFETERLIAQLKTMEPQGRKQFVEELLKLVSKDKTYNQNIALLMTHLHEDQVFSLKYLESISVKKSFDDAKFFYSPLRKEFTTQLNIAQNKIEVIDDFIKGSKLAPQYRGEYRDILLQSQLTDDDIRFAIEQGMKLNNSKKDLRQFADYIEYLSNLKSHQVRKGLKNINDIYNYKFSGALNMTLKPHIGFLKQIRKLEKFEAKRILELEESFKLQQETSVVSEIDDLIARQKSGDKIYEIERVRLKKKIKDQALPRSLKRRAVAQARHEKNILKRMMNGCNSGDSQRIAGAAKKFARFKYALALGANPLFYLRANWDKKEEDPFFWEKFGFEVGMGFFFTFVGNKIITDTSSTFWGKYLEGYFKFNALTALESYSYEALFGDKSMIRYLQKIYRGEVPESQLEKEYRELVADPDFEKNIEELLSYLKEQSEKQNTKQFLDKYLNLSESSSLKDDQRITAEDLQSPEAKEMMMELLAERIYLQSMGNMPLFQTGRKDLDRFFFYAVKDIPWNIKGLLLNLAIFELMCREPLGKIGSWGAILAIVIGDRYFEGEVSYQLRREAINQ